MLYIPGSTRVPVHRYCFSSAIAIIFEGPSCQCASKLRNVDVHDRERKEGGEVGVVYGPEG